MAVPFAIAVPAVVYLFMQNGVASFNALGLVCWGGMNSFTLTAIPLFIFMAELVNRSGLSTRIYNGLATLVSRLPGGLLQTNIVGCAAFAAITGSSVATAAAIGGVALPQLKERGYNRRLSAGSVAAGGTLGILFPPSIALIIYGSITKTSIVKLFMAGLVPAIILTGLFVVYICIRSITSKEQLVGNVPKGSIGAALISIFPFVVLMVVVMGSIYAGVATPTEAAAIGACMAVALGGSFGELNWKIFRESTQHTVLIIGNLLFIIMAAYIYSYAIGMSGVGSRVTHWLVGLHLTDLEFFGALFLLYSVLGCLIESIGMIVITVPLLFPVLPSYGISPLWFGVILVMFVELGQISPPIGINLFVIQSVWDGDMGDVVAGTIPFHLIMIAFLGVLMVTPELALWLPRVLG